MSNCPTADLLNQHRTHRLGVQRLICLAAMALLPVTLLLLANGCQTRRSQHAAAQGGAQGAFSQPGTNISETVSSPSATNSESIVLREGDTLRITFPGAENLNRLVLIRRDGRVTLPIIGEFKAAGLTPKEMEKQLLDLYGPQLQTKEVSVAVESSAFPVYVTGAVLRPGKILSDRPLTALEAIMEAGGFDYTKANLKGVRVLRIHNGRTDQYVLNLKRILQGREGEQFQLKPSDIIYVPERFSFF